MNLRKIIFAAIPCLILVFLLVMPDRLLYGDIRFKSFQEDKNRFESYMEKAKDEISQEDWQKIADMAREEMTAEWEKTAELESRRYEEEGYSEEEIKIEKEKALAKWKEELSNETSMEKGKWLVVRENLIFQAQDLSSLRAKVKGIENDETITGSEDWDNRVKATLDSVNSDFEARLKVLLDSIKARGTALTGKEKEGFEQEIERLESEYRGQFVLERDGFLFIGRNKFVQEHFGDKSLKSESESTSADKVTEEIISQVKKDISDEEKKIVTYDYNEEGAGSINFNDLGDNWKDEINKLLQYGMDRWKKAGEDLYREMTKWKSDADESYKTADAKWREASLSLEKARQEWEAKIRNEIDEGLRNWQLQEDKLKENIDTAREDFENYLDNLESQWSDHTEGLVNMSIEASKIYAEAIDNIKWLQEKVNTYNNQGYFGITGELNSSSSSFTNFLNIYNSGEFKARFEAAQNLVNSYLTNMTQTSIGERYKYTVTWSDDDGTYSKIIRPEYADHKTGSMDYMYYGENGDDPNEMNKFIGHYYTVGSFYTYEYAGYEEKTDSDGRSYIVEKYNVKFYTEDMVYDAYDLKYDRANYGWRKQNRLRDSFTVTNVITADSQYKSTNFYYRTELERWKKIKDSFQNIAVEAEQYMHNGNMLGEEVDGNELPGYLVNNGDEEDPYLMTTAEYKLKLAQQEKDFWEERLEIANAVYEYAQQNGSDRESGDETVKRKEDAKAAMDSAKEDYDNAVKEVNEIVSALKKLQGGDVTDPDYGKSIEKLTQDYLAKQQELEESQKKLTIAKESLILAENMEDPSYLKEDIKEIQERIIESRKELLEKEKDYYSMLGEKEYASRTAEYALAYETLVIERERAGDAYDAAVAIVKGEVTEENLKLWAQGILSGKDKIFGSDEYGDGAYLESLLNSYNTLTGDEKDQAGNELESYISQLMFHLKADYMVKSYILEKSRDESFDTGGYTEQGYEPVRESYLQMADISSQALSVLDEAFNANDGMDYAAIETYIKDKIPAYKYGDDNSENLKLETALYILSEKFGGLTADTFGNYRAKLDDEIDLNSLIKSFYEDKDSYEAYDPTDYYADPTPEELKIILEYNMPGSNIAGFDYLYEETDTVRMDEAIYDGLYSYIMENSYAFLSVQKENTQEGGLISLFKYIGEKSNIDFGEIEDAQEAIGVLKSLSPFELASAAQLIEDYITEVRKNGGTVPAYIEGAAAEMNSYILEIETDSFIRDYLDGVLDVDVEEIYNEYNARSAMIEEVENFIYTVNDISSSGTTPSLNEAKTIIAMYEGTYTGFDFSEDARNYIESSEDSQIKEISSFIDKLKNYVKKTELIEMSGAFLSSGYDPATYADIAGLSGDDRDAFMDYVKPLYERARYETSLAGGEVTTIADYISSKGLTGEDAERLEGYALMRNFMKFEQEGYDRADAAFAEYVKYAKFQDFLKNFARNDGETDTAYISRAMSEYTETDKTGLSEFASRYLSGESSAFSYLPSAVKVYAAERAYYNEFYENVDVSDDDTFRSFMDGILGSSGYSTDEYNIVRDYASRLDFISGYDGSNEEEYFKDADIDAVLLFEKYMSGSDSVVMAGYEYGIYGINSIFMTDSYYEDSLLYDDLSDYSSSFDSISEILLNDRTESDRYLYKAGALKEFWNGRENRDSWRDYAMIIDPDDFVSEEKEDSDGVGDDGEEEEDDTEDLKPLFEFTGGYYDVYDSESGDISELANSGTIHEKDGRTLSENRLIDNANRLLDIFTVLAATGKVEADSDIKNGTSKFLEQADIIYNTGGTYDADGSGKYSFEASLRGLVSGYESMAENLQTLAEEKYSEVSGMKDGLGVTESSLGSKKKSYDKLKDSTKDDLLEAYEKARDEHEVIKRAYDSMGEALRLAQENYNKKNQEYIDKMEEIAGLYNKYKGLEFEYEKAYSVWEYANTPYLEENTKTDPGLNEGETSGGGTSNYSEISVPDAKDNYERIKKKYEEVLADYNEKKSGVDNQETVEKLNEDSDYTELKDEFVSESQSFVRVSQVETKIEEDLEKYRQEYETAQAKYENARDAITFFAQIEDEAVKSELQEDLYLMLAHMKTSSDLSKFQSAIKLYSCKYYYEQNRNAWIAGGSPSGGDLYDRYRYTKIYADQYYALPEYIQKDVNNLYEKYRTNASSLDKIFSNYHQYMYWYEEYKYAADKRRGCSKYNISCKRRWGGRRDSRENKYNKYRAACQGSYEDIDNTLKAFFDARTELQAKKKQYEDVAVVRYIKDIDTTDSYNQPDILTYLEQERYGLTDEDLSLIYDSLTKDETTITDDTVNIGSIRKNILREDLNGTAVKVKYSGGYVYILDEDGKPTGEKYAIDDPSISLRNSDNSSVDDPADEGIYNIVDHTYDIKEVMNLLQKRYTEMHQASRKELMDYVKSSSAEGEHDYTVMLRDLENTYNNLKTFASEFNYKETGENTEIRQKSYEGYDTIVREMVNNGDGESIQGLIMEEYIRQHREFQEQKWKQQQEKFQERKDRWVDVTGFILNRGQRDWRIVQNDFDAKWKAWIERAEKAIKDGEIWWKEQADTFNADMEKWQEETTNASGKEALKKIFEELEGRIGKYTKNINENAPGALQFNINLANVLKDAMSNISVYSIGVLKNSHENTDTTAGITEIMNFGLTTALFDKNAKQMEEYSSAMSVLQNLKVIDILNGIIEGFNKQLEEANENVYESVERNLAWFTDDEKGVSYASAPFMRDKEANRWTIRVCVESNLTGDKYKTRRFDDYKNFVNSTVFLKPIKGLEGSKIDFTNPVEYSNIDSDELQIYVNLESEWLSRSIEEVFEKNGLFEEYVEVEFDRLGRKFGEYYQDWKIGELLKDKGLYDKPIFPHGTSLFQTASIAASLSGQPWAIVGVNALATVVHVQDGTTASWNHAGTQFGVGLATSAAGGFSPLVTMAASCIKYEEGGGIGWSRNQFKQGVKDGVVRGAINFAFNNTVITETLMSGIDTEGGWTDFSFDNNHWGEHIVTGVAAGLAQGGTEGQLLGEMLKTLSYKISGGAGFGDDFADQYGNFNWNAFDPGAGKLGSFLGGLLKTEIGKKFGLDKKSDSRAPEPDADPFGGLENILAGFWYGNRQSENALSEMLGGALGDFADWTGLSGTALWDFGTTVAGAFGGVQDFLDSSIIGDTTLANFGQSMHNFVTQGQFMSNEELEEQMQREAAMQPGQSEVPDAENPFAPNAPGENERPDSEGMNDAVNKQRLQEMEQSINDRQLKIVSDIKDTVRNGGKVTNEQLKELMDTIQQKDNGTLAKEIFDAIKNDKDAFARLAGQAFPNGKIKNMDLNDPQLLEKFSQYIAKNGCVLATLYAQLVLTGMDGVPGNFGDFYKKLFTTKDKKGNYLIDHVNQKVSTQTIVDAIVGEGKIQVVGYGLGYTGDSYSKQDVFDTLSNLAGTDIQYVTVRKDNGVHNMLLSNSGDTWDTYDTGRKIRGTHRPYGTDYTDYIRKDNIRSFYYLRRLIRK